MKVRISVPFSTIVSTPRPGEVVEVEDEAYASALVDAALVEPVEDDAEAAYVLPAPPADEPDAVEPEPTAEPAAEPPQRTRRPKAAAQ